MLDFSDDYEYDVYVFKTFFEPYLWNKEITFQNTSGIQPFTLIPSFYKQYSIYNGLKSDINDARWIDDVGIAVLNLFNIFQDFPDELVQVAIKRIPI